MANLVWFLTNFSTINRSRIYYSPGIVEFFALTGFLFFILHILKKRKNRQKQMLTKGSEALGKFEKHDENNRVIKPIAKTNSPIIPVQVLPIEEEKPSNLTYRLSDEIKRGERAEQAVAEALGLLDERYYTVFNNIVVPSFCTDKMKTAQIDHLVVSNYGIFCIETKAHAGAVYGAKKHQNWIYYLGRESYKIHSPVRQNYYHIKTLNQLVGNFLNRAIESYIVFVNARNIKVEGVNNIGNIKDLVFFLNNKQEIVYNDKEKQQIITQLEQIIQDQALRRILHTKNVKKYIAITAKN